MPRHFTSKPALGWTGPVGDRLAPFAALLFQEGVGCISSFHPASRFPRFVGSPGGSPPTMYVQDKTAGSFNQLSLPWGPPGLRFSGAATNFPAVSNGTPLQFNRNFSIVARVSGVNAIVSWPQNGYYLRLINAGAGLDFVQSRVAQLVTSANVLTLGAWYTVGVTVSAASTAAVNLYANGTVIKSGTTAVTFASSNAIRIGAETAGSDGVAAEQFSGSMDWIYWYDRELTPREMMAVAIDPYGWLADRSSARTGVVRALATRPAAQIMAM